MTSSSATPPVRPRWAHRTTGPSPARVAPPAPEDVVVPRGKVVGGTSAINGQVFLRGVPEDYDSWAACGNDEWSFVKCLPSFRKLETDTDIVDDFHGFDGPVPVRRHKREDWLPPAGGLLRVGRHRGIPRGIRPQ